ncbi:universal stress protein [Natronococcus wangiae]|uniref:universal stress protein n=1 Tax=Natronococcus wangiae TaxID=3068275 RepID=UPI00273D8748|nr:universal stress protein [Natronococcus sp. AD5]
MSSHILVPFDDSDPAHRALRYTFETFPDTEITVLTVICEIGAIDAPKQLSPEEDTGSFSEEAKQRLTVAEEIADEYSISIQTVYEVGPPGQIITEYADTEDVDQIIMGSHERTGIARIIVGSVSETVSRRTSSPVTTIQ